jgi:hypothetical protein
MLPFRAVSVLSVVVIFLAACGPGEQTRTEQDRQAEEYAKSFGIDANVSSNPDGTKTVAVDRNMGGLAVQGGSNLSLPAGFPDDIPMYPEINIFTASQMPNQGFMVQGQTPDAVEKVAEFYVARMTSSGWTHQAPAQQVPTMRVLPFRKDSRTATINLIGGQGTTVQLTTLVMP